MNDPAPAPQASEAPGLTLASLWTPVRKHWMVIIAAMVLCGLGAMFLTLGRTKIYEAQATMLFDPQPPRPLGREVQAVVDISGEYQNKREYYRTQFWVIQSQKIASLVVEQLRLHQDARFVENLPPASKPSARTVSVEDAARILRSRLSVEQVKDSQLAKVSYQDADPQRAQRVLGTLVDVYAQHNLDQALDAMGVAADWLGSQVATLKTDLESSELALHDYKKDKNILSVSMDDQSNMLRGEIQQLNQALTASRTQREQIAARRTELLKINPEVPANVPATELLNSSLLVKLRSDYVTAVQELSVLAAQGKGSSHPDSLAAQARIDATRSALLMEVKNVQGAVDHDFNVASNAINGLTALLEQAKQRALDLNLLEIEFNRLRRSKDGNEKLYGLVTEREKENDLTRLLRFNNIRVVDRPLLPRVPVTPNMPLNVASGLALGLALGLIGAIGREQLDRTLKTPDEAEHELALTNLGLVPLMHDEDEGSGYTNRRKRRNRDKNKIKPGYPELVVHEHPTSGVAEAARAVRTNILFMSPDRPYRTLLVTSASPSEGKTTVACNIAIAMAQAGKKVVLVDCDMRRPRLHNVFGAPRDVGVTTALLAPETLREAIHTTQIHNLSLLPTGPLPPNPAELLHSEAFGKLLEGLRERFDCVVIDSPPIAPVTDAAILATRVDGTVVVVRAAVTRKDVARRAVRSLRDVSGHIVGTVFNAVDFERRDYGYYHYYSYKKAGYGSEVPPAPPPDGDGDDSARPSALS
ncbi:MAG: polysaccharide biosynthesis tyrosine autokinase [Myxococcales bacterium]|nr:MAG: polysaccharide biosynthesis tyrosine autokinase [Myxococcales bacterium]